MLDEVSLPRLRPAIYFLVRSEVDGASSSRSSSDSSSNPEPTLSLLSCDPSLETSTSASEVSDYHLITQVDKTGVFLQCFIAMALQYSLKRGLIPVLAYQFFGNQGI